MLDHFSTLCIKAFKTSEIAQETICDTVPYLKFWTAVNNVTKKEPRYRDFLRKFSEISRNSHSIE